eukprot:291964-Chlamydomonas_euryale.AAC.1
MGAHVHVHGSASACAWDQQHQNTSKRMLSLLWQRPAIGQPMLWQRRASSSQSFGVMEDDGMLCCTKKGRRQLFSVQFCFMLSYTALLALRAALGANNPLSSLSATEQAWAQLSSTARLPVA